MTDGACLPGDTTIAMTISGNNHNVSGGNVVYGDSIENHIKNENQIKILGTCLSHVKIAATPPVSDTISSTISPTYLLDYFERCTWCAIALPFLVCYCLVISIISLPIIFIVVMIRIPVRNMSKCCGIKSHGFTIFLTLCYPLGEKLHIGQCCITHTTPDRPTWFPMNLPHFFAFSQFLSIILSKDDCFFGYGVVFWRILQENHQLPV